MGVATLATELIYTLYNCLYLERELMKELIFINSGKVTLIIWWVCSKMGVAYWVMRP